MCNSQSSKAFELAWCVSHVPTEEIKIGDLIHLMETINLPDLFTWESKEVGWGGGEGGG